MVLLEFNGAAWVIPSGLIDGTTRASPSGMGVDDSSTLALGVFCQPVGSERSLPNEELRVSGCEYHRATATQPMRIVQLRTAAIRTGERLMFCDGARTC
jgi:hypothetical protein